MTAFYDDGTGLCYWCPEFAVGDLYGVPLCERHYELEELQLMRDAGIQL